MADEYSMSFEEQKAKIAIPQNRVELLFGLDKNGEPVMATEFCDLSKPYDESLIDLFEGLKMLKILEIAFMQCHGLLAQGGY